MVKFLLTNAARIAAAGRLQHTAFGLKAPSEEGSVARDMHRNPARPLSPHLSIWRWGPHMLVSILHRMTGAGLALFGLGVLVWWLVAAANGAESYAYFASWAVWRWSLVFWVALSWGFWLKVLAGLRHLVMDIGAGFELRTNKLWSVLIVLLSVLLTAATWAAIVVWKLPA